MPMIKKSKKTNAERLVAEEEIIRQSRIVRYETKDFTIGFLVSEFRIGKFTEAKEDAKKLFFIPDYQRRFIWNNKNRSEFIESILLGLPIPFLFFCELENGEMEIVDGVQRMTTLYAFMNNQFALVDMQKLPSLNGFFFSDLTPSIQRKFEIKSLRIITLDPDTTLEFRKDLFARVNRSGKLVNDSEFRRGSFPGPFTDFIEKCARDPLFEALCPLSKIKKNRYAGFELVLRFFAYIDDYATVGHDVQRYLDYFLQKNQETYNEERYAEKFYSMLRFVEQYFPDGFKKTGSKTDVPNVRFEAISVGVASALSENPDLSPCNMSWLDSEEFRIETTSGSSNNPGRLKERVEFVKNTLLGVPIDDQNLPFVRSTKK